MDKDDGDDSWDEGWMRWSLMEVDEMTARLIVTVICG